MGEPSDHHEPLRSFKSFTMKDPMNIRVFLPAKFTEDQILGALIMASESYHQRGEGLFPSCPGEIQEENDLEKQAPAKGNETVTCTVWNDLQVATQAKLGQLSEWQTVYPEAQLKMAVAVDSMDVQPQLSVRLRDDPNLSGMCTAVQGSTLQLSNGFGDFGDRAKKHFQAEEITAEEESRLRKQRQKEMDQKLGAEVTQAILWRQKWAIISFFLCLLIILTAMIFGTVASFHLLTELQEVALAVALLMLMLYGCVGGGVAGLGAATGGGFVEELRGSVQAARPELQRYDDQGVIAVAGSDDDDWRSRTSMSCIGCAPWISLGCVVATTVAYSNGHLSGVLWGLEILALCCGGVYGWIIKDPDGSLERKVLIVLLSALFFPFFWPLVLLDKCGFQHRLAELFLKPPKATLDAAVHTTREHTIVFEGNVLPKRETVCSWPGKYETAWSELVAGSRQDDISAAVVFLPEGSEHYGFHDPIPVKHDLRDLRGECWCIPLYGERKPWGCRWWSKWIANIELAVSQECTLVVYYFNGMKGLGKVKDFTTAGKEHRHREAIFRYKDAFLKSKNFQDALEAGLKHLSKEQGPDSSSPYSREVHRLFLASLPEEARQFLQASEGLGNSQKAEVAWLERNGYPYIEKEVWELESSSPKAIGQADG